MSYDIIRDKIYDRLLTVAGVEKVYKYPVAVTDWSEFINHFEDSSGKILGFEITRESAVYAYDNAAEGMDRHVFLIRAYRSLKNSADSHNAFQELLDDVRTKFRFDHYLSGVAAQLVMVEPMQIRKVDERIFGSVLCHYAELTINVTELITT